MCVQAAARDDLGVGFSVAGFLHASRGQLVHISIFVIPCQQLKLCCFPENEPLAERPRQQLCQPGQYFSYSFWCCRYGFVSGFTRDGLGMFIYSGDFCPYSGCRVGEASNPGPLPWTLQVRNIVSAHHHSDELANCSDNCVVWTETSATRSTQQAISSLLRGCRRSCIFSEAASSRAVMGETSTGRGFATGTLISSSSKGQDLRGLWSDQVYASGRVADTLLHVGPFQLRIIAVYGYNSNIKQSEGLNQILFEEIFQQAASFALPTLVTGDFNHDFEQSTVWQHYSNLKFVDMARHFSMLAGRQPDPTYRGQSRLDYCICNVSALRCVEAFHVDPRGFTGHASLRVSFQFPTQIPSKVVWCMPTDLAQDQDLLHKLSSIPVDPQQCELFRNAILDEDLDKALSVFAKSFEESCDKSSLALGHGRLQQKFLGRARCKFKSVQPYFRCSVSGDVLTGQIQFRKRQRAIRWFRELTRASCHAESFRASHVILWTKILHAKGFPGGFAHWLLSNDLAEFVPQIPLPG